MLCKKLISLISFVLVLSLVGDAQADWHHWNGSADRDWYNTANWDAGDGGSPAPPDVGDGLNFGAYDVPNPDITGLTVTYGGIQIGVGAFVNTFVVTNGTTVNTGGFTLGPVDIRGEGIVNVYDGGAINMSGVAGLTVADWGRATINMYGGTITNPGGELVVGVSRNGVGHVQLEGGTITAKNLKMQVLPGSVGTMDVTGGTLILNGNCVSVLQRYIDEGWITGYGGEGTLELDYPALSWPIPSQPDVRDVRKTTLKAVPPHVAGKETGRQGMLSSESVQALVELLKIDVRRVNEPGLSPFVLAGRAIEELETDPEKAIPALNALLADMLYHRQNNEQPLPSPTALLNAKLSGKPYPNLRIHETIQMIQLALMKLDPNAKPYSPEPVDEEQLEGTLRGHGWEGFFSLARGKPDKQLVPMIVKYMKENETGMHYYFGMILDRLGGPDAIPALIELLSEKDWYPRYAATAGLEMLGAKAKSAQPELEKRFRDEKEDIEVRVGAARAIASIKGTDPFTLYKEIPDVENRIIKSTRKRSKAYRQEYLKRKNSQFDVNEGNQTLGSMACVYALAAGQHVDEANRWITNWFSSLKTMSPRVLRGTIPPHMDFVRVLVMFHSKSRFFPGRLKPEVEAKMKELFFNCMNEVWDGKHFSAGNFLSSKKINPEKAYEMSRHHNAFIRGDVRQYLTLSVLKEDPAYANRKFKHGDTVTQRYEALNEFMKSHLKDWSLWGIWHTEFGSSYIAKTYRAYFNLVDLAPDPEVRQFAKMWIDLSMIEHEQIAIAGVRGGSKSRPKGGGLGNSFYCSGEIAMLFGERGAMGTGNIQLPNNAYEVPDAAILLRKLGKPATTYEVANRHPGEYFYTSPTTVETVRRSHGLNYAYCTPGYVIGCAIFTPARADGHLFGEAGRWSGVIFRDLSVVEFPAYSGEKWNVQDKNVIICQAYPRAYYNNWTQVRFSAGLEIVERDGWVFAMTRNGEGYTAVKVINGGYVWDGAGKNAIYVCDESTPIIMQVGASAVYGSFEKFQEAILKAPLKLRRTDGRVATVDFTGPNSSRLEFCPKAWPKTDSKYTLPSIDNKPVNLDPEHNYNSPYMKSKVGSDVVTVRFGEKHWDYDFAKKTINTKN